MNNKPAARTDAAAHKKTKLSRKAAAKKRRLRIRRIRICALCAAAVLVFGVAAYFINTALKAGGDGVTYTDLPASDTAVITADATSSVYASETGVSDNAALVSQGSQSDLNTDSRLVIVTNAPVSDPSATPEPTHTPEPTPAPTPTPEPTDTPAPTPTRKPVKLDHKYEIVIDKTQQILTVYTLGEEGYYDLIVKQFICSTGHCDKVEDGWYKLGDKYRWKEMGNGSYAQYASRISGPYLIHSCCYYKAKVNQLKVRYYTNLGTNASSGCVRLECGNAYWIYVNCDKGTPIHVITSGEAADPELLERLQPAPLISEQYDPTDPECPEKYAVTPSPDAAPDPTPVPGVTPAPTPSWTVHPVLKAWGYC